MGAERGVLRYNRDHGIDDQEASNLIFLGENQDRFLLRHE
jgi:hypothetical protein